MVVWLRRDKNGIAAPDGIIRRAAWLQVGALDASVVAIGEDRSAALSAADEAAQAIILAAQQEAQQILADANIQAQSLYDEAQAAGRQAGIDEWQESLLRASRESNKQLQLQRERMARMVIAAVEKIAPLQDPQGVYRQVMKMLLKSMQAVRYVTVRVCPAELSFAESSMRELAAGSIFAKLVEVVADERLASGACLVESDQGVIDLSLESQLTALRAAIEMSVAISDEA